MELRQTTSAHAYLFGTRTSSLQARCSIIVAHPSDEIVGAGWLICKLPSVTVVHTTNGAPPSSDEVVEAGFDQVTDYADARRRECVSALALANVPRERILELGYPALWEPQQLVSLTKRIKIFLRESSSQIVLTHAYDGGHPDHDATAFATHVAVRLMRHNGLKPPVIFELGLYPGNDGKARIVGFLPGSGREITTLVLDKKAQEVKQRMFDCFSTQRETLYDWPIQLERFRRAPSYDFELSPNHGNPHYEDFDSGFTAKQWNRLAHKALNELFGKKTTGPAAISELEH